MIQTNARELLAYATSVAEWDQSPFGKYITFLNEHSLREVTRFWTLYCNSTDYNIKGSFGRTFKQDFTSLLGASPISAVRSCGILGHDALSVCTHTNLDFKNSGVASGEEMDIRPTTDVYVNPTFAYSAVGHAKFAVHRTTHYVTGFHLATALEGTTPTLSSLDAMLLSKKLKSQFKIWCRAYAKAVRESRVRINVHIGEALGFAHALARLLDDPPKALSNDAGGASSPPMGTFDLTRSKVNADDGYHVIDTSNITDTVGLLRILPATIPLLQASHHSVLYTESLRIRAKSEDSSLTEMMCVDPKIGCLFLGVTAPSLQSGITTAYSYNNIEASERDEDQYCNCVRTTWRLCSSRSLAKGAILPYELSIEPDHLVSILSTWYNTIITNDRHQEALQEQYLANTRSTTIHYLVNYSRATFADLLRFLQAQITTDWSLCMEKLLPKLLAADRASSNDFKSKELLVHLLRTKCIEYLSYIGEQRDLSLKVEPGYLRPSSAYGDPTDSIGLAKLFFSIPVKDWTRYMREQYGKIGKPVLCLVVYLPNRFEDWYFTVELVLKEHSGRSEDKVGLVASCFVSSTSLTPKTHIALVPEPHFFRDTPQWRTQWLKKNAIFDVNVNNNDYVCITDYCACPTGETFVAGGAGDRVALDSQGATTPKSKHVRTELETGSLECCALTEELQVRLTVDEKYSTTSKEVDLRGLPLRADRTSLNSITAQLRPSFKYSALSGLILVVKFDTDFSDTTEDQCSAAMVSPASAVIVVGDKAGTYELPCPVHITSSRFSTTKTSIEAVVVFEPAKAIISPGFQVDPLPVDSCGHLNVLKQKPISVQAHRMQVVMAATQSMATFAEGDTPRKAVSQVNKFCESFLMLIGDYCKYIELGPPGKAVAVLFKRDDVLDSILIVLDLRHDVGGGCFFLNGALITVTSDNRSFVEDFLTSGSSKEAVPVMPAPPQAADCLSFWKKVWASAAECCRQGWEHSATCRIGIAVTTGAPRQDAGSHAVCDCGAGKNLEGFPTDLDILRPWTTRVAIRPIFPAPETDATAYKDLLDGRHLANIDLTSSFLKHHCASCGKVGELKRCARCGVAGYCDKTCQRAHWEEAHKKRCRGIADLRKES